MGDSTSARPDEEGAAYEAGRRQAPYDLGEGMDLATDDDGKIVVRVNGAVYFTATPRRMVAAFNILRRLDELEHLIKGEP